jgi:hypothetical protein
MTPSIAHFIEGTGVPAEPMLDNVVANDLQD